MTPRELGRCQRWLRSQFVKAVQAAAADKILRTPEEVRRYVLGWLEGAAGWADGELEKLIEGHHELGRSREPVESVDGETCPACGGSGRDGGGSAPCPECST